MFAWPAVVRSCLFLLPTVLYMYVRTYLLFSIDIILTIFHELATINIYLHIAAVKKSPHADTDGAVQYTYVFVLVSTEK